MNSNVENDVQKAKDALGNLKNQQRPQKSELKELIFAIAEDVHERMREGYTIQQIVAQLNAIRDENDQINEGTFRGYLQQVRGELGIGPVRSKKKIVPASTTAKKKPAVSATPTITPATEPKTAAKTAAEFRNQDRQP